MVYPSGQVPEHSDDGQVRDDVGEAHEQVPLEAVGGDGVAYGGQGECGRGERKVGWSILVKDTISEGIQLLQQLLPKQ